MALTSTLTSSLFKFKICCCLFSIYYAWFLMCQWYFNTVFESFSKTLFFKKNNEEIMVQTSFQNQFLFDINLIFLDLIPEWYLKCDVHFHLNLPSTKVVWPGQIAMRVIVFFTTKALDKCFWLKVSKKMGCQLETFYALVGFFL